MEAESLAELTVLIVDDGLFSLRTLQRTLQSIGVGKVIAAGGGAEALETLKKTDDIDLVISDVMMPEIDGYELARRLREGTAPAHTETPVILLTGQPVDGTSQDYSHIQGFILKPATGPLLMSEIGKVLGV